MSKDSYSKKALYTAGTLASGVILFISGQVFGVSIFSFLMGLAGISPETQVEMLKNNTVARLGLIFSIEVMTVALVWMILARFRHRPEEYLKLKILPSLSFIRHILVAFLLYFLTSRILIVISDLLIPGFDASQEQKLGFTTPGGIELVPIFLALVVLPPLAEEIFFRGFLYQTLKRTVSIKIAAVLTGALFGLAHLEFFSGESLNWAAAIDTFTLSFFLIAVLERTRSIWSSIMLHGLKNSIAFVIVFVI